MVLEKCKQNSSRPPNSFIIFRTFFSSSISDSTSIPSYHVGERSKIAQSVWKVASENLKNAFKSLGRNVREHLYLIRGPSFVPFNQFRESGNHGANPTDGENESSDNLNEIEPFIHVQNLEDFTSPSNTVSESFDDFSSQLLSPPFFPSLTNDFNSSLNNSGSFYDISSIQPSQSLCDSSLIQTSQSSSSQLMIGLFDNFVLCDPSLIQTPQSSFLDDLFSIPSIQTSQSSSSQLMIGLFDNFMSCDPSLIQTPQFLSSPSFQSLEIKEIEIESDDTVEFEKFYVTYLCYMDFEGLNYFFFNIL